MPALDKSKLIFLFDPSAFVMPRNKYVCIHCFFPFFCSEIKFSNNYQAFQRWKRGQKSNETIFMAKITWLKYFKNTLNSNMMVYLRSFHFCQFPCICMCLAFFFFAEFLNSKKNEEICLEDFFCYRTFYPRMRESCFFATYNTLFSVSLLFVKQRIAAKTARKKQLGLNARQIWLVDIGDFFPYFRVFFSVV